MNNKIIEYIDEFKPHYMDSLNFDDDITFGVEIECEDIIMSKLKEQSEISYLNWQIKRDFSLKDNGVEVASPVFKDTKDAYDNIKKMCDILIKLNGNPNNNSSLQVQYGINIFENNYENLLYFYKLWSIYENIIYRYSYGEKYVPRSHIYNYAQMISSYLKNVLIDKTYIPFGKYDGDKLIPSLTNYALIFGNNRSYGISFRYTDSTTFNNPKTIEIRPMNGTINNIMIQNYINFYYHLISYPRTNKFDKEFIDYKYDNIDINKNTINESLKNNIDECIELTNLIFDDDYDKLCFIKQYMKEDKLIRKL